MPTASRKTHMVRIVQPKSVPVPDGKKAMYVDIEVLDCIAYSTTNGHVHVWDCKAANADPFIEDKTGDDPNWSRGGDNNSRGSHAKAFTKKDDNNPGGPPVSIFDYEVLDRIGFTDDQAKVWILDHPQEEASAFNVTTGKGSAQSTRRTHLEQINATYTSGGTGGVKGKRVGAFGKDPATQKKNDGTIAGCLVQERVDIVAFQGLDEKRLIINLESHDDQDPESADPAKARAATITDPPDYDPNNEKGPKPPEIEATQDLNLYIKLIAQKNKGGPVFGLGASGYFWSAEVTAGGAPNFGETVFSSLFFSSAALALANYEQLIAELGDFLSSPTIGFSKGKPIQIGDNPPSVTLKGFGTPTIGDGKGADGTFISMGPLWWVRKWSPDGTD